MNLARTLVVCVAVGTVPAAMAQKWEIGGGAGAGFYTSNDLTAPAGTATAKIKTNVAGSFWLDNNTNARWGGELRYDYQRGALSLKRGSTEATFSGEAHQVHYDFLYHFADRGASVRPFVAFGGGIKVYRGTGNEVLVQPLSNIALLTRAQDLKGMVSVGAGIKMKISAHAQLRLEVHDYLTPYPNEVIVPVAGHSDAWINDIVPMVGISYTK